MDLQELQRILQKGGGRIIIVENGKPLMVVMPYEEFGGNGQSSQEIAEPLAEEDEAGELTIDDLPL